MAPEARRVVLGRTGLTVSRIGLGSSMGIGGDDLAYALDRGINYFYFGTYRKPEFAAGLRALAARREDLVLVVQSYARIGWLLRRSVERALRALGTDRADLLLLGMWNEPPPARVLDEARRIVERGLARHLMVSCHRRPTFAEYIRDPTFGAIMVRYSAAHTGAEREVFPLLEGSARPGVVSYTATRWGALLDPRFTPAGDRTPTATDCYRFVLTNPSVDVCLSAPSHRGQLEETLAALDGAPMDAGELEWMRRVGRAVRETHAPTPNPAMQLIDRLLGAPIGEAPKR